MWNPFAKKAIALDNTEIIYADDSGLVGWPLSCDQQLFETGLTVIRKHLKNWILQDIIFTTDNNQAVESSLVYQLKDFDLKLLPYDEPQATLQTVLKDTPVNASGTRLMDAFVRITMEAPIEALEALKGRMLYGMVYCISRTINDTPMPSKQQWVKTLQELPWVIYLPFLQELYETDTDISKMTDVRARQAMAATISDHRGTNR